MPFRNQVFNKLVVQSSNGQLIIIDPGNVNPQISFYSQDRTNIAFINAPNNSNPSRVAIAINSGQFLFVPDGINRTIRCWLDDASGFGRFEVIKSSNQNRLGGYVYIGPINGFFGYRDVDGGVDQFLRIDATSAQMLCTAGNIELDAINGQKLILNSGGLDLTGDALTFRGNAGAVNFNNYGTFNFGTDNDLFNDGRVIPRGIMGAPAATSLAGTATAVVGTEVRDAVLGNFVFTARATRRYRVRLTGRKASGAVNSLVVFNIRDGGAATPTAASPLLATSALTIDVAGGPGQITMPAVEATVFLSAGTHTLSAFTNCAVGGPAITPVGACELYAEDIGV